MTTSPVQAVSAGSIKLILRPMIWLVAILTALALPGAAEAAKPKRVLLLHSFGPDFAPWNAYSKIIRAELARQWPGALDIYDASLATAADLASESSHRSGCT